MALPGANPEASEWLSGRFSLLDITGGLSDDSREADERAAETRLAELRGRLKAARKALAPTPGAAESMRADWRKEVAFLARFGIMQEQLRHGVIAREEPDEAATTQAEASPGAHPET